MSLFKYVVSFCLLVIVVLTYSCKKKEVLMTDVKKEVNYIPYYLKIYEADSLFLMKNYKGSYKILDSLFKNYVPINMENYNEYSNYILSSLMTGNIKDIDVKIKKGFTNFGGIGINVESSEGTKLYDSLEKVSKFNENDFKLFLKEYEKKINLNLRKRIEFMEIEDQSVRKKGKYDYKKMAFFEKKHRREIEEIITKYGYPNYQVIGNNAYNSTNGPIEFKIIFLHQSIKVKQKYLPMLLENLKKGKCLPDEYAFIYDKVIQEKTMNSKTNKFKQFYGIIPQGDLMHPKKIDSIRKSIGLPRLGYDEWAFEKVFGKTHSN